MRRFSESLRGELVTRKMLVSGLNDDPFELAGIAEFLASVNPRLANLSAPIGHRQKPG
jgi:wyosine [tRNA(Phe)-imidazoG37] synthetase (radical SAM superfamily)